MKIYTLLHISSDDPVTGNESTVTVYAAKEAARAAMEAEIKAAVEQLRDQYADQPNTDIYSVEYEVFDDNGYYGDGIICERWEIKAHEITVSNSRRASVNTVEATKIT